MKKFISTVAALGLVFGAAATASALDLTVSGKYILEGYYIDTAQSDTWGAGIVPYLEDDDTGSMSAWVHTFLMKPVLKVNDNIKMVSDIRFLKDTDMGGTATNMDVNDRHVDVHKIYMEYMSPIGKWRVGRTPAGAWAGDFLSSSGSADRIMWWPSFVKAPFSMLLFTQKSVENDWYDADDDSDSDLYEIGLDYKTDTVLAKVAYDYFNIKTGSDLGAASWEAQRSLLKAYANIGFGNAFVEAEGAYYFGDDTDFDAAGANDIDADAQALMVNVGAKMDKLVAGVMYVYCSGDDDATDGDQEAVMNYTGGTGDDFNPFYIFTGDHTGALNSDEYNGTVAQAALFTSGLHAVGVWAEYAATDKLTLHAVVGAGWADDTDQMEALFGVNVDDEYGWEVDLGARYKLLDNLTYEARAGYMDAGDFMDDVATNGESEDVVLLSHHLTMTF